MKSRFFLASAVFATLLSCGSTSTFLVGNYTNSASEPGIELLKLQRTTATLEKVKSFKGISNPSYFTINKRKSVLYTVNENGKVEDSVSVFQWDKKTGSLNKLQQLSAQGSAPCHIATDRSGKWVVVSNYSGGNVILLKAEDSGRRLELVQTHQLPQISGNPHAHMAQFSNDNRHIYVTDLGNDRLYQFSFDSVKMQPIGPEPIVYQLPSASGPRHFAWSRNEKFLYLLRELDAKITVFEKMDNGLKQLQTVPASELPNTDENKGSAAIKTSPDGNFLYASTRGKSNSISVFKIEKGLLRKLTETRVGLGPRDFVIDSSGRFLLCAERDSRRVTLYRTDKKTGGLTPVGHTDALKPVFIKEL